MKKLLLILILITSLALGGCAGMSDIEIRASVLSINMDK